MAFLGVGRAPRVFQLAAGRGMLRIIYASFFVLAAICPSAASSKVRVSGLSDVNFGAVSNLGVDAIQAQSVCLYAQSNQYSIRADGSGTSGAYILSNGTSDLAYEVRWNSQAGQTNGTALSPAAILGGLTTNAQNQNCASGPATTASLVLVLPATALSSATQGSYSGTLTLIVAEE